MNDFNATTASKDLPKPITGKVTQQRSNGASIGCVCSETRAVIAVVVAGTSDPVGK